MDLFKGEIKSRKVEIITVIVILLISLIAHSINMFHYPYYEADEGTYMSQAWSLVNENKLAPYTYFYDHSPFGWAFIAYWTLLTGGFFTFGFSINSGRVLMLILHIFSALFLYLIAKKLTKNRLIGVISVLLFSLSPLAIYFQRRVLLDNIMTFWLLLSLFLILDYSGKLNKLWLSAVSFGVAVLAKETAAFFLPAFIYVVALSLEGEFSVITSLANIGKRNFSYVVKWLLVVGVIVLLYPLMALSRGELFPGPEKVSLISTLIEQLQRGGGNVWQIGQSDFWINIANWLKEDPLIILFGLGSTLINLFLGIENKTARILSYLNLSIWFYFMRGGLVLEFYIIPAIPFLALNIAFITAYLNELLVRKISLTLVKTFSLLPYYIIIISLLLMTFYYSNNSKDRYNIYLTDQTTPQVQAVDWMLENIPGDAFVVIDNFAYVDLNVVNRLQKRRFDYYWKVDLDPEIAEEILNNDPNNIDFVALTPQMERDAELNNSLDLTREAINDSVQIMRFWNAGWGVEVRR